jgi:putative transposase
MKIDYWQKFEYGQMYHIYNRAVSNRNLFESDNDYKRFLLKHDEYFHTYFDTMAYCLMPNHFHFLVKLKSKKSILSKIHLLDSNILDEFIKDEVSINDVILNFIRRFYSSHAIYINRRLKIRGPLFVKRFKRVTVDPSKKLQYLVAYIHHNPIHHGFTRHYADWVYSSYNSYYSERPSRLSRPSVLADFGSLEDFTIYHQQFQIDFRENYNID